MEKRSLGGRILKTVLSLLMCLMLVVSGLSGLDGLSGAGCTGAYAAESSGITLRLHYHRDDGAYSDWDVWLWEYGKDGSGYPFTEETVTAEAAARSEGFLTEGGKDMVATMAVTDGTASVGFIVRTASWSKDINEDQFIDLSALISGSIDVYVESGVKGYTFSYGEDAALGIKTKTAVYNNDKTVTVTMTAEVEDAGSAFTVSDRDGNVISQIGVSSKGSVYTVILSEELDLSGVYYLGYDGTSLKITMPIFYSTDSFEEQYTYSGDDLGAVWSKDSTTFRVWAPTADGLTLNLYESGTEGSDDLLESYAMSPDEKGTWLYTVEGDLNGTYYTYTVNVNGSESETVDPYARTTGVNGKRGMVIDLDSTDPEGWDEDSNPHAGESINDAIIYEAQIRDLTVNSESGISNKGKYLGLTETGTTTSDGIATGIDHLVDLGITHLHILPFYDFGSVDETSAINKYNWGYDPVNYNVPEGSYSTDPYNGEVRVAEVKEMVKALHDNGISVVMDVVYNHVYSASEFCFNVLVPGYFSRMTESGTYSNGSGCGNDTATERSMVRKYIVDSVCYWADEYHIDGFRFDLVGLIDTDTVNEIVEEVHKTHPDVIFYGEGWTLTTLTTKDDVTLATQTNSELTPGFAYFNDTIRDALKGSVFNSGKGFVSGASAQESAISRCFLGADRWCESPSQTINYASCHDNNTLYDRLKLACTDASEEDIIRMNDLAASIYILAEGVPFMSSGEEFLRSKTNKDGSYNSNSYNAGDTVNSLKWANLSDPSYAGVYEYYKGLIAFRKAHGVLRLSDASEVEKYVSTVSGTDSGVVAFSISGGADNEPSDAIYIIYNSNDEAVTMDLPAGEWNVCINADQAGTESLDKVSGSVTVDRISAMVLVQGRLYDESMTLGSVSSKRSGSGSASGKGLSKGIAAAIAGVAAIGLALAAIFMGRRKK